MSSNRDCISERKRKGHTSDDVDNNIIKRKKLKTKRIIEEGDPELSEKETEIKKELSNFKQVERQEIINTFTALPRANVMKVIDSLETNSKRKTKKVNVRGLNTLKKYCYKTVKRRDMNNQTAQELEHTWESPTYLTKCIRASILTSNWNNLTRFLLLLLKFQKRGDKRYFLHAKQVALLNLMYNPADTANKILNEYKEMFT